MRSQILEFPKLLYLIPTSLRSALVLAGCTSSSSSIAGLYLVSLSYRPTPPSDSSSIVNPDLTTTFANLVNGSSLEVRTGYFSLCVRYASSIWVCDRSAAGLARQFQPYQDPLNLIWASQKFKDGIVFSGLMYALCDVLCLLLRLQNY